MTLAEKHWVLGPTRLLDDKEGACGHRIMSENIWDEGTWDTEEIDCLHCVGEVLAYLNAEESTNIDEIVKWANIAHRIFRTRYEGRLIRCENKDCKRNSNFKIGPQCPDCNQIGVPTNLCAYCGYPLSESGVCTGPEL